MFRVFEDKKTGQIVQGIQFTGSNTTIVSYFVGVRNFDSLEKSIGDYFIVSENGTVQVMSKKELHDYYNDITWGKKMSYGDAITDYGASIFLDAELIEEMTVRFDVVLADSELWVGKDYIEFEKANITINENDEVSVKITHELEIY